MAGPFRAADDLPLVEWRPGVWTRLHTSWDGAPFCVIEQWCDPGTGAPTHTHFEVAELIAVINGEAAVWVDGESARLRAGDSVLLPPHSEHGFRNAGETTLHTFAFFGAPTPRVRYADDPETVLEVGGTGEVMRDAHRAVTSERAT